MSARKSREQHRVCVGRPCVQLSSMKSPGAQSNFVRGLAQLQTLGSDPNPSIRAQHPSVQRAVGFDMDTWYQQRAQCSCGALQGGRSS
eukprot:1191308-Prorocentrum_minimum.AAC.8